jgi:hypothetical protein
VDVTQVMNYIVLITEISVMIARKKWFYNLYMWVMGTWFFLSASVFIVTVLTVGFYKNGFYGR